MTFKIDRNFKIDRIKQHRIINKTITFRKVANIKALRAFVFKSH